MSGKKLLHIVIGFSILLQAAFFQVAMPNLVLCIGENGHIAFEWRSQDGPGHHKDGAFPNLFTQAENNDSVSDNLKCTDINLHFHPSQAEKTQTKTAVKTNSVVFFDFELRKHEQSNPPSFLNRRPSSSPHLRIGTDQSPVLII